LESLQHYEALLEKQKEIYPIGDKMIAETTEQIVIISNILAMIYLSNGSNKKKTMIFQ